MQRNQIPIVSCLGAMITGPGQDVQIITIDHHTGVVPGFSW
jgi:hypothetical protein